MDQPSPRRRFQFSLRTLLIGVTVIAVACAYIGWEAKIVRERDAALAASLQVRLATGRREPPTDISWMRRLLGDRQYAEFVLEDNAPDELVAMLRLSFPEATVCRVTEWDFDKRTLKRVPLRQPPQN
jgi:hypothetical protein